MDSLTDKRVFVDGHLVSENAHQVVAALKDYSPELDVQWVPESARAEGQAAYAIIHRPVGHPAYVLFYVQDDKDMDFRVVQRVIANDQRNGKTKLSELEAWEAAQALVQRQKDLDAMEEAHDMARFILKTPLHTIRMNKDWVIEDHGNDPVKSQYGSRRRRR